MPLLSAPSSPEALWRRFRGQLHGFLVARLPSEAEMVLLFCTDRARFEDRLPRVLERTTTDGMIWVCWPKKAAQKALGLVSDLDENVVRDFALAIGIVDVKVAAVDDVWSGLKLVRRLADR